MGEEGRGGEGPTARMMPPEPLTAGSGYRFVQNIKRGIISEDETAQVC
jgi:hypothetical protein